MTRKDLLKSAFHLGGVWLAFHELTASVIFDQFHGDFQPVLIPIREEDEGLVRSDCSQSVIAVLLLYTNPPPSSRRVYLVKIIKISVGGMFLRNLDGLTKFNGAGANPDQDGYNVIY